MTWLEFWGFFSIVTMILIALLTAIVQRHREDMRNIHKEIERLEKKIDQLKDSKSTR